MPLVDSKNQILKTSAPKFDFAAPPMDPVELARTLAEEMLRENGMGIAANQLGLLYRVFAVKSDPILVCFNPIVVDTSSESIYLEEGCLSFPGVYVKVKRPKTIKTRYTMANGETVTKVYEGMTARIFQHELDHLDGITMRDRATSYHWEQAVKKANKVRVKALSDEAKTVMEKLRA